MIALHNNFILFCLHGFLVTHSAKIGLIGLSNTLAVEGAKYNIKSNAIVPVAGSRLTEDILPENLFNQLKPQFIAPVVCYLVHESCEDTGGVYEAAGGWVGKYRWSRSLGKAFIPPDTLNIESVRDSWSQITNLTGATQPSSVHDQMSQLCNALAGEGPVAQPSSPVDSIRSPRHADDLVDDARVHSFGTDDLILYALSVGATTADADNLRFVYEGHECFQPLPTYGVIPPLGEKLHN